MSVADDATSWLYNKVRDKVIDAKATLADEDVATQSPIATDDTGIKIQLMNQQASRAKFDKWLKRAAFFAGGAAVAYVYFTMYAKKGN